MRQSVSRREALSGIAGASIVSFSGCLGGGGNGDVTTLSLGTSARGSIVFEAAQQLSQIFDSHSDTVRIDPVSTPGFATNPRLLDNGEIDVANNLLSQIENVYAEEGEYSDDPLDVSPVQIGYTQHTLSNAFFTYPDNDIETVQDLAGRTVSLGPSGSIGAQISSGILEAAGVLGDVDEQYYSYADTANAVRDGNVDAWDILMLNRGATLNGPHTEIMELQEPKWVEHSQEVAQTVADDNHLMFMQEVTPDDWGVPTPNIDTSIPAATIGTCPSVTVPDLDDDVAYEFMEVWNDNLDELRDIDEYFSYIGFDEGANGIQSSSPNVPWHNGAADYLKDIGEWNDDLMTWDDYDS